MIRLAVLALSASIMIAAQAVYHDWVLDECYHVGDGSVISSRVRCTICGAGNRPFSGVSGGYCSCHDPHRSVAVRSRSLGSSDTDPVDANNLANNINGELDDMPPSVREALDWSEGMPSYGEVGSGYGVQWNYKPVGSVVTTSGGSQGIVSGSPTGIGAYVVEVPNTSETGSGGVSVSGYSSDGTVGSWTITPGVDGTYGSSFTPNWSGGVGGRSGTSSLSSPSSGYSSGSSGGTSGGSSGGTSGGSSGGSSGGWLGLAFVGGGSSGGSSGGSYSWSGGYSYNNSNWQYNNNTSTENYNIDYENSTHLNYYFNQPETETRVIEIPVNTGAGSSSGGSSSGGSSSGGSSSGGSSSGGSQSVEVRVISVPSQTVTLDNGQSFTMRDYTSILNAIGGYLSSGFSQTHTDLDVINENLRRTLEIDDVVDLEEPKNEDQLSPLFDDQSDRDEVKTLTDQMKEDTSGWKFDFGMGNNPIGNFIKGLIGNPPMSFGSRDEVCSVSIPITKDITVDYSFQLTHWFGSAFRSCILFILSIIFIIATAKTISGAFA